MTALVFLGITGVLLIWDLKHPLRFYLIFTKHQWRSWLVKGAFIIGGYGGIVVALPGGVGARPPRRATGSRRARRSSAASRRPCYTAYLFAQAKARDLWQSPLLPAHLAVQAVLAGAAALLPFAVALTGRRCARARGGARGRRGAPPAARRTETNLPHVTAHAAPCHPRDDPGPLLAASSWSGVVAVAVALAAPWIGVVAAPFALVGLAGARARLRAGRPIRPTCLRRSRGTSRLSARAERVCGRPQGRRGPRRDLLSRGRAACTWPRFRPRNAGTTGSSSTPRRGRGATSTTTCWCRRPASTASRRAGCWPTSTTTRCRSASSRATPSTPARGAATAPRARRPSTRSPTPTGSSIPLRRVGERGEGQWERMSWDEALDAIAARIRAAIIEDRHNEIMYHVGRPGEDGYTERVLASWGVDGHNSHTNVCSSGGRTGYQFWMGIDRPSPDHANAKVIYLISSPPGDRPLLQPARPADHRGEARTAPSSSCSTPGCPTPPRTPTTGCRRSRAARPRSTWPSRSTSSPPAATTASSSAGGGTGRSTSPTEHPESSPRTSRRFEAVLATALRRVHLRVRRGRVRH